MAIRSNYRNWFVIEGQAPAVRQTRRFLERNEARAFELRPNTKPLYFAAELLLSAVSTPLLLEAQSALRSAGISGKLLSTLLEHMSQKTVGDLVKGARTTWGGPLNECSQELVSAHFEELRASHPDLAADVEQQLEWARSAMQRRKDSLHTRANQAE
jgi:hypothetical protein